MSRESCGSVHIFEGLRFVLVQPITFNTDSVALKIYFYNRDVSESIVDSGKTAQLDKRIKLYMCGQSITLSACTERDYL